MTIQDQPGPQIPDSAAIDAKLRAATRVRHRSVRQPVATSDSRRGGAGHRGVARDGSVERQRSGIGRGAETGGVRQRGYGTQRAYALEESVGAVRDRRQCIHARAPDARQPAQDARQRQSPREESRLRFFSDMIRDQILRTARQANATVVRGPAGGAREAVGDPEQTRGDRAGAIRVEGRVQGCDERVWMRGQHEQPVQRKGRGVQGHRRKSGVRRRISRSLQPLHDGDAVRAGDRHVRVARKSGIQRAFGREKFCRRSTTNRDRSRRTARSSGRTMR